MSDSTYKVTHLLMLVGKGKPTDEGVIMTNSQGKMLVKVNSMPSVVLLARPARGKRQTKPANVVLSDFSSDEGS